MSLAQRSLIGFNVILGANAPVEEDVDGLDVAVNELMGDEKVRGFGIDTLTPYLNAAASGFGGGDKAKADADAAAKQAQAAAQAAAAQKKPNNTTLYVVLGLLGAGLLGFGGYLVARK